MKRITVLLCASLHFMIVYSQSVAINTDGTDPDASSILDLKSTGKGLLIPRMTKAQRDAIVNPANGLLLFQTDNTPGFYAFNGNVWSPVNDNLGNHVATKSLNLNGFQIFNKDSSATLSISRNGDLILKTQFKSNGSYFNEEKFRIDSTGGFLVKSKLGYGVIPVQGDGDRFMWYSSKGAFRAGNAFGDSWDDANVGAYSWAGGEGCKAAGNWSVACGYFTNALTIGSAAFGSQNNITGLVGFSAGFGNKVSGSYSVAFGQASKAEGTLSIAMGEAVTASGNNSIAMGYRANTHHFNGAMAIADASTTDSLLNTANNQFVARYAGGYKLFSNSTSSFGVQLAPGAGSWSSISDSTKKENFISADPESFLQKMKTLKLGSWNYKTQEPGRYRHYGPMAQEIFSAYGKDSIGIIGCDTLLASADMDGIMMILLKGLEKRTTDLASNQKKLEQTITVLKSNIALLVEQNSLLKKQIALLEKNQNADSAAVFYKEAQTKSVQ